MVESFILCTLIHSSSAGCMLYCIYTTKHGDFITLLEKCNSISYLTSPLKIAPLKPKKTPFLQVAQTSKINQVAQTRRHSTLIISKNTTSCQNDPPCLHPWAKLARPPHPTCIVEATPPAEKLRKRHCKQRIHRLFASVWSSTMVFRVEVWAPCNLAVLAAPAASFGLRTGEHQTNNENVSSLFFLFSHHRF